MRQLLPGDKILDLVREDYSRFLAEYGLTEAWVTAVVADMSDHAEMPPEYDCYSLGSSAIHGRGLSPWASWFDASCVDLTREARELLATFGHLPSLDVTTVEKQSKETK